MKTYQTYSAGSDFLLQVHAYKGTVHTITVFKIVTSTHPDDLVFVASVSPKDNEEAKMLIDSRHDRWWE